MTQIVVPCRSSTVVDQCGGCEKFSRWLTHYRSAFELHVGGNGICTAQQFPRGRHEAVVEVLEWRRCGAVSAVSNNDRKNHRKNTVGSRIPVRNQTNLWPPGSEFTHHGWFPRENFALIILYQMIALTIRIGRLVTQIRLLNMCPYHISTVS